MKLMRYSVCAALGLTAALSLGCCPICKDATALSRHVFAARATGSQVVPPSEALGMPVVSTAYMAQDYLVRDLVAGGEKVAGYKVAFTSQASQIQFRAPGPAYGRLFASQQRSSGAAIPAGDFHRVTVEMEVAMVIAARIDKPISGIEELRPYVRAICPALELPNDHFSADAAEPRFEDLIVDNLGAHRFVLGAEVQADEVKVDSLSAALTHDGQAVAAGRGRDVLGSPWASLLWVVNGLVAAGIHLEPGDVVLTGSLARPYSPPAGKAAGTYVADFGALGKVTCTITP